MAKNKLSETKVKSLEKPGIYGDGDGLYIRVQKGGSRNWVFVWKRAGQRNEIGLGGYGQGTAPVPLALAREKAEVIRGQLARGDDPRTDKRPAKVITFEHCMKALLETKKDDWKNEKHKQQWLMTLREYAKPLHDMPIADIVMGDVKECLAPHWQARPETADRLRSRIQAVIDYGIAHEWRTAGNPARWKGLLDKVMPARQKLGRGHHAALAYSDIPAMVKKLRTSKGVAARAVEFSTLTAARSGETRGAVWQEIDKAKKLWTIPADRMKAGVEHRVPLTDAALTILESQEERATGDLVFGGGRDGRPISDTAMTKALRLAAPKDGAATLHGLRSSFRDWAGDMTSHPREVAEQALAHVIGGVEAAYRRSDALQKRRKLMEDWSNYVG
ncbi:tyrosine-type recombinase/integrase [Phyllobacterium chamaecytisi]|uniref:tyrosine-type recombinase/integrase n=1 Tax=Phyllobacterium chamaecytisi TaxID=2876082 RepID=UPI001CCE7F9B|nr:integrase arm-type DNA-binding domain-containing protein [Phyllobacterium sp. KW56]